LERLHAQCHDVTAALRMTVTILSSLPLELPASASRDGPPHQRQQQRRFTLTSGAAAAAIELNQRRLVERRRCIAEVEAAQLMEDTAIPAAAASFFHFTHADLNGPAPTLRSVPRADARRELVLGLIQRVNDAKTCLRYLSKLADHTAPTDGAPRDVADVARGLAADPTDRAHGAERMLQLYLSRVGDAVQAHR
jgi:hypothetical protein